MANPVSPITKRDDHGQSYRVDLVKECKLPFGANMAGGYSSCGGKWLATNNCGVTDGSVDQATGDCRTATSFRACWIWQRSGPALPAGHPFIISWVLLVV